MINNNQTLFGLTIGPIFETMSHAKKTRELWFGSFFFSWYIKKFCQQLESKFTLLTPVFSGKPPKAKAGLFPDHVIGTASLTQSETIDRLKEISKGINDEFVNMIDAIGQGVYLVPKSIEDVRKIFNDYLEVSFIVRDAAGVGELEIIKTMDLLLDGLERERSFSLGKNENTCNRCASLPSTFEIYEDKTKKRLCPFCFFKYRSNASPEVCAEIGENKGFRYRSTGDISAHELLAKIDSEGLKEYFVDHDEIDFDSKEFRDLLPSDTEIKSHHKYMAIVQADGDSLGDIAKKVTKPEGLSQALFEFGQKAVKITEKFHGEPVYLGGDDLLTFMPTGFKENGQFKTVIDYINELSQAYNEKLKELDGLEAVETTLSFGVHIFYYKSPLSLALQAARTQQDLAKSSGKDALSMLLTQHAGQQTTLLFKNDSDELESLNKLLKGLLAQRVSYPHGIHHNLARFEKVLTNLSDMNQLKYFKENRFNEEIHTTFNSIDAVFDLLELMLADNSNGTVKPLKGEAAEPKFREFLSQLRFIKFLVGDSS